MSKTLTYSPSKTFIVLAGYQIVGWDSVTITRRVDDFVPVFGIRGKHCTVPTNDTSCFVTINVIQSSPSNDVLSEIHRLDIENGTGRLATVFRDTGGRSVFHGDEGRILGYPEVKYSGDIEYRVWRIFFQTTKTYNIGGNQKPESLIQLTR